MNLFGRKIFIYLLRSTIKSSNELENNICSKCLRFQYRFSSSTTNQKSTSNSDRNDEPMNFFGSEAAGWKAKSTRSGGSDETLWYQPYVISCSLAIFLLYFCVLREENDVDQKLSKNLFDHIEGFEEMQLKMNYKYNKEHGLDVTDIEARLKEIGVDLSKL